MGLFKKGAEQSLPVVDLSQLDDKIKELIIAEAIKAIPDEEKLNNVVDQITDWLDDNISYGNGRIAKLIDDNDSLLFMFIGIILKSIAKKAFDELRELGQV